jgi:hypothetical protein
MIQETKMGKGKAAKAKETDDEQPKAKKAKLEKKESSVSDLPDDVDTSFPNFCVRNRQVFCLYTG